MSKNLTALSARKGLDDNLFERIGTQSEEAGSLESEEVARLAKEFLMGEASILGTTTFYDFTKPANRGKKAYLCNGTACRLARTQSMVKEGLTVHFCEDEIGEMSCLGRCYQNGAFQYQGKNYSVNSKAEVSKIIENPEGTSPSPFFVSSPQSSLLTIPFPVLSVCREILTILFTKGAKWALEEIQASRLRGRGGAGFPIGVKMEACRNAKGKPKFIVCNADEGDPGSYSDRFL